MNWAVCQLVRLRSANRRSGLLSESQTAAVTLARFTFGTGQKSELALRVLIQRGTRFTRDEAREHSWIPFRALAISLTGDGRAFQVGFCLSPASTR